MMWKKKRLWRISSVSSLLLSAVLLFVVGCGEDTNGGTKAVTAYQPLSVGAVWRYQVTTAGNAEPTEQRRTITEASRRGGATWYRMAITSDETTSEVELAIVNGYLVERSPGGGNERILLRDPVEPGIGWIGDDVGLVESSASDGLDIAPGTDLPIDGGDEPVSNVSLPPEGDGGVAVDVGSGQSEPGFPGIDDATPPPDTGGDTAVSDTPPADVIGDTTHATDTGTASDGQVSDSEIAVDGGADSLASTAAALLVEILSTSDIVVTPAGRFENVVTVRAFRAGESATFSYYAADVGLIKFVREPAGDVPLDSPAKAEGFEMLELVEYSPTGELATEEETTKP